MLLQILSPAHARDFLKLRWLLKRQLCSVVNEEVVTSRSKANSNEESRGLKKPNWRRYSRDLKYRFAYQKEKFKPTKAPKVHEEVTEENQYEMLSRCIQPLAKEPYEKQLEIKHEILQKVMEKLADGLRRTSAPQTPHQIATGDTLPCVLEPVRPSPVLDGYRNKDTFEIYPGLSGKPTAGFQVARQHTKANLCVFPREMRTTNALHLRLCKKMHEFAQRTSDKYKTSIDHKERVLKSLLVRSTEEKQIMVVVFVNSDNLSTSQIEELKDDLRHLFIENSNDGVSVSSLYLVEDPSSSPFSFHKKVKVNHLHGVASIAESCMGLNFQISPPAFFQINTKAAEVLYDTVTELAGIKPSTTLLDVCCGTGTIGIVQAKKARSVIGVDRSEAAVKDAKENAIRNGITNAEFFCGNVEKMIPRILRSTPHLDDVVAVVNPSRNGLYPDVIRALRCTDCISRVVYVSCKPDTFAMRNFIQLSSMRGWATKLYGSDPLVPTRAVPVDLFPHSPDCELVLCFDRIRK